MSCNNCACYNVHSLYGGRALLRNLRTWQMLQIEEDRRWASLLPELKVPYLEWSQRCSRMPTSEPAQASTFSIRVIGLLRKLYWRLSTRSNFILLTGSTVLPQIVWHRENDNANVSLICVGLLGRSPLVLAVTFEIELLEIYHQLRRHQATLGVQMFLRSMVAFHDVSNPVSGLNSPYLHIS